MIRSTPGLPVCHQLPEFTQTHAHRVGDAIQPSHPLSSLLLLPPIPLFQWDSSSHEVAKVLEFSLSVSPSSERPGLIFRMEMDWLDLLTCMQVSPSTDTRLWRRDVQCLSQGTNQTVQAANARKAQTPHGFQGKAYKDRERGRVAGVWTAFWLAGGEVIGSQHHQPSGSSWSGISVLVGNTQLTSPIWWGVQSLQSIWKDLAQNLLPLRRNWRSSTLMAKLSLLSCLTVFLCSCIFSLLQLNLFFGTWGRPRRLKFFYNQEAGRGHREGRFVPERPSRVLLGDNFLFFFFFFLFLNPGEEQVWNEKGNKVLDTEINHKLSGGTQF